MKQIPLLRTGCVPLRSLDNAWQVCLVNTTSDRGQLIFPRGKVEDGESLQQGALRETYEEAGLRGALIATPIFADRKGRITPSDDAGYCYFPLLVEEELTSWPEETLRRRHWTLIEEALAAENCAALRQILSTVRESCLDWCRERLIPLVLK